ncbi:N-acetylmuramoyl-L-alanine amidase [compost metagenome]
MCLKRMLFTVAGIALVGMLVACGDEQQQTMAVASPTAEAVQSAAPVATPVVQGTAQVEAAAAKVSEVQAVPTSTPPAPSPTTAPSPTPAAKAETKPAPAKAAGNKLVMIDPGHQRRGNNEPEQVGPDTRESKAKVSSGTVGVRTKKPEYVLNLEVSALLKAELVRRGINVTMTRETHDVDISNKK